MKVLVLRVSDCDKSGIASRRWPIRDASRPDPTGKAPAGSPSSDTPRWVSPASCWPLSRSSSWPRPSTACAIDWSRISRPALGATSRCPGRHRSTWFPGLPCPSPMCRSRLLPACAASRPCERRRWRPRSAFCRFSRHSPRSGASCSRARLSSCVSTLRAGAVGTLPPSKWGACGWRRRPSRRRHTRGRAERSAARGCPRQALPNQRARHRRHRALYRRAHRPAPRGWLARARSCRQRHRRPTRGQGRFRLARREDGVRGGPVHGPGRAGGAEGPADFQAGRTADRGQLRRRHRGCSRAGTGRACQHQGAIVAGPWKLARRPDGCWTAGPRPAQPIELARRRRRPGVAVAPDGDAWRHLARG